MLRTNKLTASTFPQRPLLLKQWCMNTKRNSQNNLLLPLLFVFASSGSSQTQSIDFDVKAEQTSEANKVVLIFNFKSEHPNAILIDWDALSIYNPQYEDESVKDASDLNAILNHIKHSQFVIENKQNQQRLFFDVELFEGETMDMKSVFPIGLTLILLTLNPTKL